jgi:5-(carboxyamino)imidazole ribonucleotide synthase
VRVGVLGGGQLGRMLALAGYPLGISCRCFDTDAAPAGQVTELVIGEFHDAEALSRFAAGMDVVTYEFENVPLAAAEFLARRGPVFPPPEALRVSQDRLAEKMLFRELGIPTPAFAPVSTLDELQAAVHAVGLPAVLKTRRFGYDGKGQRTLREPDEVAPAWEALGSSPLILEAFVPFQRELSILTVRSRAGDEAFYPLVQNEHESGILRLSLAPAPAHSAALQEHAEALARRILERLGYVGVLALELFEIGGDLLASEIAPRVHNSGHWTIEGAETSQFENHLRAVSGLPLGSTAARGHSAMVNLIGSLPDPEPVLRIPGAHMHVYGKSPRPGRKVGHITVRSDSPPALEAALTRVRSMLPAGVGPPHPACYQAVTTPASPRANN